MIYDVLTIKRVSNGYVVTTHDDPHMGMQSRTLAVFNTVEGLNKWLLEKFDINKSAQTE